MNEAGKSEHISAETVPSAKHPAQALLDTINDRTSGGEPTALRDPGPTITTNTVTPWPAGARVPPVEERPIRHLRRRGLIYFLTDGEQIKIGFSTYPDARLKDIEGDRQCSLVMLGFFKGCHDEEGSLHRHFKHLHVRGDWFRSSQEIIKMIRALEDAHASSVDPTIESLIRMRGAQQG
jgi:hypothetical protein